MSTLDLAWRLARAGGRFRTIAVVAGNAIGTTLFLLTLAIPTAIRDPRQEITPDDRLLAMSVVVFLCLPITVLLMSIGRLSGRRNPAGHRLTTDTRPPATGIVVPAEDRLAETRHLHIPHGALCTWRLARKDPRGAVPSLETQGGRWRSGIGHNRHTSS